MSAFTCLQPVVGAAGASVFLNEVPTTGELIGGIMIVGGLLLTVKDSGSKGKKLGFRDSEVRKLLS